LAYAQGEEMREKRRDAVLSLKDMAEPGSGGGACSEACLGADPGLTATLNLFKVRTLYALLRPEPDRPGKVIPKVTLPEFPPNRLRTL
jgi:hypothetical protein